MVENKRSNGVNKRIDQLEKQKKLYEAIDNELTQGINLYRFIVENSHIGIFIIDDNYTIVYGNNELVNIMGYSLDEIVGSDFRDYIAMGNQGPVADRYTRRQKGEILPHKYEVDTFHKNGAPKTVEISVAVTRSFGDRMLSVIQVFDITNRKQMEAELEKSRKKYQDIFHNVFDVIFIHDLDGVFVESNAHYVKELGGEKDFLVGKNIKELMPEELHFELDDYLKRIVKKGRDEGLLTIIIPEGGIGAGEERILEYRNSLIYDEKESPVGVWGSARDITASLKDKNDLIASEQRFREIIEGTPIPTVVINKQHRVSHWNEACEKLTGVKAREIIGTDLQWKPFYSSKRPILADLVLDRAHKNTIVKYYGKDLKVSKVVKGGYEIESFFPQLASNEKWLFVTAAPIRDTEGNITGAVETLLDITEKKHAEQNLLKMHEALEEKVKDRTQSLEEANIAMKVLLKKREEDRQDLEEQMLMNIREIVLPYLDRLKSSPLKENQKVYLDIIERNLLDIASPFMKGLSEIFHRLTPAEIQIINLIKQDKTSKEIADFLSVSPRTVEFHRDNIRKKLGIKKQKINLRSYLASIG